MDARQSFPPIFLPHSFLDRLLHVFRCVRTSAGKRDEVVNNVPRPPSRVASHPHESCSCRGTADVIAGLGTGGSKSPAGEHAPEHWDDRLDQREGGATSWRHRASGRHWTRRWALSTKRAERT